ncbi:amylo-alpha-1,6-glucosidase [Lyngbya aestuarii]|uniref:amylo-alpha-1,6-glucosidase n=1 Tax=Lyngbya aestuarii TaxID=118322 RepID=UPI00403DA405
MIDFGREICGNISQATAREWLVSNGIGGYASGTLTGQLTRCYHGLLVAALNPPLGRTLLLAKLEETVLYDGRFYPLSTNHWASGVIGPHGYRYIESFELEGKIPVWRFACADALLEKRIWMHPGSNTTYVHYYLSRATQPLTLTSKALVNYRDHHGNTQAGGWRMSVDEMERGCCVTAFPEAASLYLFTNQGKVSCTHNWYYGFGLAVEGYRGLIDYEDHLHAATFEATLKPGESLTFVASTERHPGLNGEVVLELRRVYEQDLLKLWQAKQPVARKKTADWVNQLVLAADQFIVNRPLSGEPDGKTIIAGYHWFGDWGRDTMISLPGLAISTGRWDVAREILRTFSKYVSQGMLPNRFPDFGKIPEYNTVDATLWYFEAIRAYYEATGDNSLLEELFPVLADIIDWHCRGTRYNIHLDTDDGLLYAGTDGVQLTWMDAKVDDWVVTPRIGKPIEVNALWHNALRAMAVFADKINQPSQEYQTKAEQTAAGFRRFWNEAVGYCYDVLDGPEGEDASLRPNQIFAVSLPESPLEAVEQRLVVEAIAQSLLTSHGLRSLAPDHPQYRGIYGGNQLRRDGAYHQGTVWGWLIGPFVLAHLRVYHDPVQALSFLKPMINHLEAHGVGSLSEIFDGDAPMNPRGCIAQAWTVAQVLQAWEAIGQHL